MNFRESYWFSELSMFKILIRRNQYHLKKQKKRKKKSQRNLRSNKETNLIDKEDKNLRISKYKIYRHISSVQNS